MPTRCGIEGGGYMHGMVAEPPPEIGDGGDRRFSMGKKVVFQDVVEEKKGLRKNSSVKINVSCSDESSSSIGKNSDLSENSFEKSEDCEEVQSSYNGPLNAMEDLEQILPIRRGISGFYNGKSKSFASLADASSLSSIKDIAKADNPYTRKQRNLLACSRSSPLGGNGIGGGISKKVNNSSKSMLALAVAKSNSDSHKPDIDCNFAATFSGSSLPRNNFSTWRSFSLADLQHCTTSNRVATKPC